MKLVTSTFLVRHTEPIEGNHGWGHRRPVVGVTPAGLVVAILLALVVGAVGASMVRATVRAGLSGPMGLRVPVHTAGSGLWSPAPTAARPSLGKAWYVESVERPQTIPTTSRPAVLERAPSTAPAKKAGRVPVARPVSKPKVGHSVSGIASWYDDGPGLYAAAGPALRVGKWRGRLVYVDGIALRLVDYCGCPHGRVIDLSPEAFARIAPLSRGLVEVRVSW